MVHGTKAIQIAVLLVAACLTGCSSDENKATENKAPEGSAPASLMPASWKVVRDPVLTPDQVAQVSANLGVDLSSLKNTDYEVEGKIVKLNTMVVSDEKAAKALMSKLRSGKPDEFLLRKGLTVYEFMCKDNAIPLAQAGRKHLEGK